MSKPYDATTRKLIEMGPLAWLKFLGVTITDPDQVQVIDSNLSTVSAEADRVIRIGGLRPWIEHVELQAVRDARLADRVQWYNTLLGYQYAVPVHSVVMLLRPEADGPELTGTFERQHSAAGRYLWFQYNVVRVWQQPVEGILAAGLPVLPLAPVSDVGKMTMPEVLMAVSERLIKEASLEQAATLWAATHMLMGLRYSEQQVAQVFEGVSAMILGIRGIEESSVYQGIIAKGRAAEGRDIVLRLGKKKFGEPRPGVQAKIDAIDDLSRLNTLLERILDVSSWDELLASPGT